jgi:hypothetical protein
MSQFEKFQEKFDSKYKNIWTFIDELEYKSPSYFVD